MGTLIYNKTDIEARMGFRPGRFTSPNKLFAFALASMVCAAFFFGLNVLPESIKKLPAVAVVVDRGIIPYVTLFAFAWGIFLLWLKSAKARGQHKALVFLAEKDFGKYTFNNTTAGQWVTWLSQVSDKPQRFILLNRLRNALISLRNLENPGAIQSVLQTQAENDEAQIMESYSFSSMLVLIIPLLGFVGTVLGLSGSIGGFGQALGGNTTDIADLVDSLKEVTANLEIAFDTTLLALLCALVLQLYQALIRARETQFLEDCTVFCEQEFLNNLGKNQATQPKPQTKEEVMREF